MSPAPLPEVEIMLPMDFTISSKFGEDGQISQASVDAGGAPALVRRRCDGSSSRGGGAWDKK